MKIKIFLFRYLIKNTSLTSGFMSELTILEVGHRDRGEYMCVASNGYGQDHTMILLLVQGKYFS